MKEIELVPYFESKPWAGSNIRKIYNLDNDYGEAWLISTIRNKESKLIDGTLLSTFVSQNLDKLGLNNVDEFPVLIKIIDAKEDLSIQLHPDDEYARLKGYPHGKYEMWYVLKETTNNKIVYGLKDIQKETLIKAINEGKLENYLNYIDIHKSSIIKVIPGTVHAILRDTFILEAQDPLDVTYRIYDYNRLPKRELHIDDAINVIYKNKEKVDLDKFEILEKEDYFLIKIKGYSKFFIKVNNKDYKTYLVLKD